ncbi:MAG: DUF4838 domain-containing protein [Clostridia bacterium]|nr:DUF4838 domain-containing protein [Clostridia bacterium]
MKRFIVSALCLIFVMLSAFSASADSGFKDVKEGAWYYDAVMTTVEKGIFSGVAEDRFDPNGKMTRAMFVTTLAKVTSAEVGEYTGTPFADVKSGAWYAPYVQWAYENEITSGVSSDRFGVDIAISREQMVTLFYNTAAKFGADVEITDTFKYAKVSDLTKIDAWAQDAVKWAMQNSILSGTGNNGKKLVISPDATATRAQAAQIITKYLEFLEKDLPPVTGLTFNGIPVEEFTVVYRDGNKMCRKTAEYIKQKIEAACGVSLEVITDSQDPEGPEILVGHTNREAFGVKYYQDGEDICSFEITVQGNFVTLAGKDDNYDGTEYAGNWFAKEILEIFFCDDDVAYYNRVKGKDIPDGYIMKESPLYEYRAIYWSNYPDEVCDGSPFHGTGMVHNIMDFTETLGRSTGDDPCLTDPVVIENAKKNVAATLTKKPGIDTMWISMNDTDRCCMCPECQEVYREEGSRFGTWARFLNIMAEVAEPINPDVDLWTLAYLYSTAPCETVLDENIVVYYCTLRNCASHTYNDPSCPLNRSIYNHMTGWSKVCSKMYVWDYSTDFTFNLSAFPIATALRENKSWFYDLGVRGEFNNAVTGKTGEFGPLKAYLIGELQWDPKMPEDEYNDKINAFLKAYYGPGWKYIREYIDITEELSDENHFSYYSVPRSILTDEQILANRERLEALWDAAEANCENSGQLERIQRSRLSWTFMKLNGSYINDYVNGDATTRAAYVNENTVFYGATVRFDVRWTEKAINVVFDAERAPFEWVS